MMSTLRRQRRSFAETLFGQPESRHVSYGFQRSKAPTHIRFRRNGRHRSSLPGRSLSLDDLANAARQHDQLVDRHDGHRAVDDLFESPEASPLPLVLVGLLIAVFLGMAARRRLRRNYVWILAIQALAYYGKIAIHPTPAATLAEFYDRAMVGPIPGWIVLMIGFAYNFGWLAFALGTMWLDQREHAAKGDAVAMG